MEYEMMSSMYEKLCRTELRATRAFTGEGLLKVALLLAFSCMFVSPAYADEISLSAKAQDKPTLDYLKDNNIQIPQKGTWDADKKTWSDAEAIIAPESVYTLTKVDVKGDNTITKFEWNSTSMEFIPQYYRVDLKKTSYGEGDLVRYYEWSVDDKGKLGFKEVSSPTLGKTTIEFRYSKSPAPSVAENGDISGNFIDNDHSFHNDLTGAIMNSKGTTIDNISGTFLKNQAYLGGPGAILNSGTINNITGDFVDSLQSYYQGGVDGSIYNDGKIGNITGNFIAHLNSAGTAMTNAGTINNINGNFIGNLQGAINNSAGFIGNITGSFIGNSNSAIKNSNIKGHIGNITADFIGNSSYFRGGAIYTNLGTFGNIIGDFIGNTASDSGGAIYSDTAVENIAGDFISNSSGNNGGAITLDSADTNKIAGNFINNSAYWGGAIYAGNSADAKIGDISANFINNTASYDGGAVSNRATIDNLTSYFGANKSNRMGGALLNGSGILNLSSVFEENKSESGGAIYNNGRITNLTSSFNSNSADLGGAIYNDYSYYDTYIKNIESTFASNHAVNGGAIYNSGNLINITSDFIGNNVSGTYEDEINGGAIYNNDGVIGTKDSSGNITGGIVNSNFYNNYASSKGENNSKGGAIYTQVPLNIIADNGTSIFKGNYIKNGDSEKDEQAIYVAGIPVWGEVSYMPVILDRNPNTLTFQFLNGGTIYMYDNINGDAGYIVNINGDNTGRFALYNDIFNANVTLADTTLDTINNDVHNYVFNSFQMKNNAKMLVDVDLKNEIMDRISASTYDEHNGMLTVSGMNLLSDTEKDSIAIYFAENGLKNNVLNGTGILPENHQTVAYTPIYKYKVGYDIREDGGYFVFDRSGTNSANSSDKFNPSVLSSSTAASAGGQSIINETVRFAFQHADYFSQMPYVERIAFINQNKYAITEGRLEHTHDFEKLNKGVWLKPFTSFESIHLKNGPNVDAITYGSLIGFDTNFKELRNGWYNVQSGYVGYNGSQLNYSGVDTSLNGGLIGLTETFYKDNLFTALTATAGTTIGTSNTMYGHEDFTMLLAGIGSKTGYNFEFRGGKYILQPIMFMNYSFANTFDYTNAAGVRMKNSPFHTFQINPSVKAIANLENGWQPYASVGFVWNILNSGKVRANNVVLPSMSVDPYVEYGLGVQKCWKDKFTGYLQAMVRNGGRNGVALSFGFRWAIGKNAEDL